MSRIFFYCIKREGSEERRILHYVSQVPMYEQQEISSFLSQPQRSESYHGSNWFQLMGHDEFFSPSRELCKTETKKKKTILCINIYVRHGNVRKGENFQRLYRFYAHSLNVVVQQVISIFFICSTSTSILIRYDRQPCVLLFTVHVGTLPSKKQQR